MSDITQSKLEKFGRSLPKHELMEILLEKFTGKPMLRNKATQTEKFSIRSHQNQPENFVQTQVEKVDQSRELLLENKNKYPNTVEQIMKTLKKKVFEQCDDTQIIDDCSDWSDGADSVQSLKFPRETRRAVEIQLNSSKIQQNIKSPKKLI